MLKAAGLAAAVSVLATAAAAQVTTVCEDRILGSPQFGTVCKQKSAPDPNACAGSMLERTILGDCSPADVKAANQRLKTQKSVGALIADGKCEEAKGAALRAGDLDLAARVAGLCAPK